jgi:lipopolysaccharide export LptBFGC system permease protein LptF
MKEKDLDSLFKKAVSESNDFYADDADSAKERIWNQVRTKKQVIPLFYRILAVASILLLIFLSVMTYSNLQYKTKINQLVETNGELRKDNQILKTTKRNSIVNSKSIIDTVFVEKRILQSQPVVTTEYVTDTVYLKQVVYVEKEKDENSKLSIKKAPVSKLENNLDDNELISNSEVFKNNSKENLSDMKTQSDAIASISNNNREEDRTNSTTEIIIRSDKDARKKKKRKFRIKFGERHSKTEKEAFAINTRF